MSQLYVQQNAVSSAGNGRTFGVRNGALNLILSTDIESPCPTLSKNHVKTATFPIIYRIHAFIRVGVAAA